MGLYMGDLQTECLYMDDILCFCKNENKEKTIRYTQKEHYRIKNLDYLCIRAFLRAKTSFVTPSDTITTDIYP